MIRLVLPLLCACTLDIRSEQTDDTPEPALTIEDLWDDDIPDHTRVAVHGVVISQPTLDGRLFYVQQEGGGPRSGLQVQLGDGIIDRVPPIGARVRLVGPVTRHSGIGPDLWLRDEDELDVVGEPVEPVAAPFANDLDLVWTLVRAELTVISEVDPTGMAWTDLDLAFRPDFGVPSPGWNRTGTAVMIPSLAKSMLLRDEADWTGGFESDPPLEIGLTELAGLADGTPVVLEDLVQATPWSVDARHAVIQDAAGLGLWVDTEGFGAPPTTVGDRGTWTGTVITTGEGLRLRVWRPPELTSRDQAITWDTTPEDAQTGALVEVDLVGIGPGGIRGERASYGWLLDNRFREIASLVDGQRVQGAVRWDASGTRRLAVLP